MNHHCRERDRLEQLKGPIGQAAYSYYAEWMKESKRSVPVIETFATSSFYSSFIKFAEWVKKVHMPNPRGFILLMVRENLSPMLWARDNAYALYMQSYDQITPPEDQFLNSLEQLQELAGELRVPIGEVFETLGVEEVLLLIQKRKLSPWFLITSKRFREFMEAQPELDEERLKDAIQVGAMIMRVQQSAELTEIFGLFCTVAQKEGL